MNDIFTAGNSNDSVFPAIKPIQFSDIRHPVKTAMLCNQVLYVAVNIIPVLMQSFVPRENVQTFFAFSARKTKASFENSSPKSIQPAPYWQLFQSHILQATITSQIQHFACNLHYNFRTKSWINGCAKNKNRENKYIDANSPYKQNPHISCPQLLTRSNCANNPPSIDQ